MPPFIRHRITAASREGRLKIPRRIESNEEAALLPHSQSDKGARASPLATTSKSRCSPGFRQNKPESRLDNSGGTPKAYTYFRASSQHEIPDVQHAKGHLIASLKKMSSVP